MSKVSKSGAAGAARKRRAAVARPGRDKQPGEPGQGRREQSKLDKRARIRDAAWELFTSVGFDRTTTKAVAARAGVASGTLFLYAKDKPDLLFLVYEERLARLVEQRFASLPRGALLIDQLMYLFRGVFEMYAEHPAVALQFVRALPGADSTNAAALHGLTLGFMSRMASLVRQGQERGELATDIEPMRAASNFFSLYFGALTTWMSGLLSLSAALDPNLRDALELQIRGLLPRK